MIQQKETVFERNTGILFSCTTIPPKLVFFCDYFL